MRDLADVSAQLDGLRPDYVAAAGNDGADIKHFPAAWRDGRPSRRRPMRVDLAGRPPTRRQRDPRDPGVLAAGMLAVGSWTGGARDPFSNCGKWVNGIAAGAGTVSRYPSQPGWAIWSGTSFATPRVSAAVAGGPDLGDVVVGAPSGRC